METRKTIPGSSPTRSGRKEQESILVVDHDVRVIELLQITLSGRGYTVCSAFDGETALEEVARKNPELVVLDVRLPRMNGFQVLEAIRQNPETVDLPVILISGNPANEGRIQGLRLGADDYLVKPFSPRELIIKIRRILDRASDQKLLQVKTETLEEEVRKQRHSMLQADQEMYRYLLRIGSVLHHVEDINVRGGVEDALDGFVQAAISDLGLQRVCLLLRDGHGGGFQASVWRGIEDRVAQEIAISADGFLGQVIGFEGRTMTLDEFEEYPRARQDLVRLSAAGFTHITPIRLGDKVVALIAGGDKEDGEEIDRFDAHLLGILSRSAAIAMQNADAFAEMRRSFVDTTAQLIATVEERYANLKGHSARVHDLALRIDDALELPASARETVAYVALLHDLGALEEYDSLFGADKRLTDAERVALRRRTCIGVRGLLERAQLPEVSEAVYRLNEYWDGSGLPEGLAGEAIPLATRIVAIANAYDALTHSRPHRRAYGPEEAAQIIRDRAGHQFDPVVVEAFEKALGVDAGQAVGSRETGVSDEGSGERSENSGS
jgi:response regulator RpfG family c-di-GMP phosphodiesterase